MERIIKCTEFFLNGFFTIACHLKSLNHNIGAVIADCTRGKLHTVADNIILICFNGKRIFVKKCIHFTLRHGKRIMRKCKISIFILFKHRKIRYIAKLQAILINQIKAVRKLCSDLAGKIIYMLQCITDKEQRVIRFKIQLFLKLNSLLGGKKLINRAFEGAVLQHFDIAKALHAYFKCKFKHFFKPALRLLCTVRNIDSANRSALKCLEFHP